MEISSYRIPLKIEGPISDDVSNANDQSQQMMDNLFGHLYIAANIVYQHYYQLLANGDSFFTKIYADYQQYQTDDREAWETLNEAKIAYCANGVGDSQRQVIGEQINQLPEKIYKLRYDAKHAIYEFAKNDSFLVELQGKFSSFIPESVMHYSMARVLQELFTDYSDIQLKDGKKDIQPLRVYSKKFPAAFNWGGSKEALSKSVELMAKREANGEKTVYFYLYQWAANTTIHFKCRIGKNLPELATLFNEIETGKFNFHNLGDPIIQQTSKATYVLQFVHKKDENKALPQIDTNSTVISMGVDLGYKVPIAWAINKNGQFVTGEILEGQTDKNKEPQEPQKDIIKNERNKVIGEYKQQIAAMQHSRSGQGRARKAEVLKKRRWDEKKFFQTMNAQMAIRLVDIAMEHHVGIIKIEDLDFDATKRRIKKWAKNSNLFYTQRNQAESNSKQKLKPILPDHLLTMYRQWSYGDLVSRIEKKARENNIMVARVNPAYTSQECHKCGNEGNRKKQSELRFTDECKANCKAKDGVCVLIPFDNKRMNLNKKSAIKNENIPFTHYLHADNNAAKRMALAQQYHTQNDKL